MGSSKGFFRFVLVQGLLLRAAVDAASQDSSPAVILQPVETVFETPVLVTGVIQCPTTIVIGPGETITVANAPTTISTVVTITSLASSTLTLSSSTALSTASSNLSVTLSRPSITLPSSLPATFSTPTRNASTSAPNITTGTPVSSSATATPTTPTTSTTSATSTTCTPATTPSACASSLPEPCSSLGNDNGLDLVAAVPLCVAALGPFAAGTINQCLATTGITPTTTGSSIVTCLLNAITSVCIVTLPGPCQTLGGSAALPSPTQLAACAAALGPFVGNATSTCLTRQATAGQDVFACLFAALGLTATPPAGPGSCPATACVSTLPPVCESLGSLTGPAIIPQLAACAAAIGANAARAAAACLNPANILPTTPGANVVQCLLDAERGVCISTLPAPCEKLQTDADPQLVTDIPACVAALGALAAGPALACFTNPSSGPAVVACLNTAYFG